MEPSGKADLTCSSMRSAFSMSSSPEPYRCKKRNPCYKPRAASSRLCGPRIGRGAQAVECGLEDWFEVAGVAVDRGDGDDHVENLLEGDVVADLVSTLRGGEERPAGRDHPGAVAAEYRVAPVGVLEQFGSDVALAGSKGEEPVQPSLQNRPGRLAVGGLGGLADGVDLVGVEGLEKLSASG